jgi:hypothetical protein
MPPWAMAVNNGEQHAAVREIKQKEPWSENQGSKYYRGFFVAKIAAEPL